MKALIAAYWKSLPAKTRASIVFGSLGFYVLLVPILGIAQLRSGMAIDSLQASNQKLEKNLDDFSGKLDSITKDGANSNVTQQLQSLRDEVIQYRAEQQGRDQVLGLTQYGADPETIGNAISTIDAQSATATALPTPTPTPTLAPTSTPIAVNDGTAQGNITLLTNQGWNSVDVFISPITSSKIVGQMSINLLYPYFVKQNDWYQIELAPGNKGWVRAQFVTEK